VLGIRDDGHYLASDVPAFIEYTDRVVYLDDGQFARINPAGIVVTDAQGAIVETAIETVAWDPEDAGKSGYDHYMLKEIHEQPRAIRQCLRQRVTGLDGDVTIEELASLDCDGPVQFVACGTSYHAACYGAQLLLRVGRVGSVFSRQRVRRNLDTSVRRDARRGCNPGGETADTMRCALRAANRTGATTLALTNTVGSSAVGSAITRCSSVRAGDQRGRDEDVRESAGRAGDARERALGDVFSTPVKRLRTLPDQVQWVLDTSNARSIAETYEDADAYFFIGRGYNAPVAREGALKMKEITYKHAEGFAAGELKHGPLAMVSDRTPVFALVTGDATATGRSGT